MPHERILFVTGRLAEPALRRQVASLSRQVGFEYDVSVLGISIAALMHVDWVARNLHVDAQFDRVLLPGWCQGEVDRLSQKYQIPFVRGPKDLYDLPEFFGQDDRRRPDLNEYDIEIIAEINHAPRLSDAEIVAQAERYRSSGADVIDLGCIPGPRWARAGDVTRLLRREGVRVSIDSFERSEVEASVGAGAELVLSCNSGNLDWAARLDTELVAIGDDPRDFSSLERTVERLLEKGARFRIDPILEPIGFGFAESLSRYFAVRRKWPDAAMMMGVGNLTELTEVDSAGINVMLAALCQELRIGSVLTTEVINWARTAVREFDLARRLVYYAQKNRTLPKHVDSSLLMLRDARLPQRDQQELAELASRLTDPNIRIFVECGEIHVMNRDGYWRGTDAFELFDRMTAEMPSLTPSHAFYLGYELSKAVTALTLGKRYTQDESLRWGFLTVPEQSALQRRRQKRITPTERDVADE